jgi:hypothetical protein
MARRTLSNEVREGILRDLAANVNKAVIAKTWGVSIPTVYNFLKRQSVASVTPDAAQLSTFGAALNTATVDAPVAAVRKNGAKASR